MTREETTRTKLTQARAALTYPQLYRFLRWKYQDEPILERGQHIYPVVAYAAPDAQIRRPDSILLTFQPETKDKGLVADATYRTLRQSAGSKLEDLPTFTMQELLIQPTQLGLTCAAGTYFQALDTCDALEWELLSQITTLRGSDETTYRQFDRQLSLRWALHTKVAHPVRHGAYRSAALAISTLLVYTREGRLHLVLQRRPDSSAAVHSNQWHVIPSGMFQPSTRFLTEEFSLTHNISREYLEELFDYPEPTEASQDWRYFYQDPRLVYLQSLLETHQAELYLTGIAIDLLNLRPEICTLLLIRSPEWYQHHTNQRFPHEQFRLNQEWAKAVRPEGDAEVALHSVPYQATDEAFLELAHLSPGNILPPGAAAFWLGVDVLRRIL